MRTNVWASSFVAHRGWDSVKQIVQSGILTNPWSVYDTSSPIGELEPRRRDEGNQEKKTTPLLQTLWQHCHIRPRDEQEVDQRHDVTQRYMVITVWVHTAILINIGLR
jgi:hypothetical protein